MSRNMKTSPCQGASEAQRAGKGRNPVRKPEALFVLASSAVAFSRDTQQHKLKPVVIYYYLTKNQNQNQTCPPH